VAHILVTGSAQGLGRATAEELLRRGHRVVVHARNDERATALTALIALGADVVVGDLASRQQTRELADQVNQLGPMDAVVHNAGVYADEQRFPNAEGHPRVLAVNVLAPYLLTTLLDRPDRLIYLTSDMHAGGNPTMTDLDWTTRSWNGVQAYRDSKLFLTALAFAVARRWPQVRSNAVDPGWVPTRMGGPHATDDLEMGYLTQVWLATSDEPEAAISGRYWHHQQHLPAPTAATDPQFQDAILETLAELTGTPLPAPTS
jgi:NAD(P)-dependent dehydrogenase (short-subunit alcohol dehydrogenase family)